MYAPRSYAYKQVFYKVISQKQTADKGKRQYRHYHRFDYVERFKRHFPHENKRGDKDDGGDERAEDKRFFPL